MPNDTSPANSTLPNNDTSPTNGTSPQNGTSTTNSTLPNNDTSPTNSTLPNNGTSPGPAVFESPSPSAVLPEGTGPSPLGYFTPSTSYINGTGVDPNDDDISSTMQFSEIFYGVSLLVTVLVFAFFIKKTWRPQRNPMVYSAVDDDVEENARAQEDEYLDEKDIEMT